MDCRGQHDLEMMNNLTLTLMDERMSMNFINRSLMNGECDRYLFLKLLIAADFTSFDFATDGRLL